MDREPAGEESFAAFVRARWGPLLRVAYSVTGDMGRAEDVLQEAFARLWPRWRRLRDEDPNAYVRRVVVNEAISAGRRPWRRETPTVAVGEDRQVISADPDLTANRADLARVLAALPPRQRAVIVLRYVEDLSEAQVADILGCTVGTVKTHASRGLARLRAAHPDRPATLSCTEAP